MKIALLFTGHLRTAIRNETLLPRLVEANGLPDIFIHTYRTLNAPTPNWHGDTAGARVDAAADLAWVLATYPRVLGVEMSHTTGGHEHAPPEFAVACPARWSASRALRMMHDHESRGGFSYDVVFFARFDLWLGAPLVLPMPEKGTIYGSHLKHDKADGDVFGYAGSVEAWNIGSDPFPPSFTALAMDAGQEGEQITTARRKQLGYEYRVHPVNHGLLRSNGVFVVAP